MSRLDVVLEASAWTDVEEGTEALLERWLVAEGDRVSAGQPLAIAVLVKTSHEIHAPADGVLARILVRNEETFARGQPLGEVDGAP